MRILAAALLLSGCHTMYFHNDTATPLVKTEKSRWHHNFIFSLIEVSPPLDLKRSCHGSDWEAIKVERNFLNVLAGLVSGSVIDAALTTESFKFGLGGAIWDPWSIEHLCRSKTSNTPQGTHRSVSL